MNKMVPYLGIIVSAALAYLLIFSTAYALSAILVGIPLFLLEKRIAAVSGFAIGFLAPVSLYLLYPMSAISQLSGIISQLTGLPSALLIIVYPLMYGIIAMLSALLFTGLMDYYTGRLGESGSS